MSLHPIILGEVVFNGQTYLLLNTIFSSYEVLHDHPAVRLTAALHGAEGAVIVPIWLGVVFDTLGPFGWYAGPLHAALRLSWTDEEKAALEALYRFDASDAQKIEFVHHALARHEFDLKSIRR